MLKLIIKSEKFELELREGFLKKDIKPNPNSSRFFKTASIERLFSFFIYLCNGSNDKTAAPGRPKPSEALLGFDHANVALDVAVA